jgi:hypothetical protein
MNAEILNEFVQVPYSHYMRLTNVLGNLATFSETLVRVAETPECYTRRRVFDEILPACREAILHAQAEADKG